MPPPGSRAVVCELCGQSFFKASMPFHQKQCQIKAAAVQIPCPGCMVEFPRSELNAHMAGCRQAKAHLGSLRATAEANESRNGGGSSKDAYSSKNAYSSKDSFADDRSLPRSRSSGAGGKGLSAQGYDMMAMSAALGGDGGRIPCAVCGRKFAADRIAVHQRICTKVDAGSSRRKVFNSTVKRLTGVVEDAAAPRSRKVGAAIGRLAGRSSQPTTMSSMKAAPVERTYTSWREKHRDFIKNVREARQVTAHIKSGGNIRDLPPSKPSGPPSHYVECRYCHRNFAPDVAERHIPKCKTTINRPGPPPRQSASTSAAGQSIWQGAAPRSQTEYSVLRTNSRGQLPSSTRQNEQSGPTSRTREGKERPAPAMSKMAEAPRLTKSDSRTKPQWADWGEATPVEKEKDMGRGAGGRGSARNIGTYVVGKGWKDESEGGVGQHGADLASLGKARLQAMNSRKEMDAAIAREEAMSGSRRAIPQGATSAAQHASSSTAQRPSHAREYVPAGATASSAPYAHDRDPLYPSNNSSSIAAQRPTLGSRGVQAYTSQLAGQNGAGQNSASRNAQAHNSSASKQSDQMQPQSVSVGGSAGAHGSRGSALFGSKAAPFATEDNSWMDMGGAKLSGVASRGTAGRIR